MGNRSGQVSVKARNTCGYSNPKTKTTSISCREAEVFSVGVDEVQVYPNPTAENVTLKFTMTEQGKVHLELLDLAGRSLIKLDAEYVAAGEYTLELPLIDQGLAPGTYLIRVIRNEKQDVLRIVLSY
ncbi:MAG: T9SS type A sorting domain-containing protein [Bacteroidetes bacterium]|nr:T9SS type A sorting domain-containing protein [Bacteroidota bacterium]